MRLRKVKMMVSIPEEHWEAFKGIIKETGHAQFKYRDATIFAEIL